jgi:hypothetical protein
MAEPVTNNKIVVCGPGAALKPEPAGRPCRARGHAERGALPTAAGGYLWYWNTRGGIL